MCWMPRTMSQVLTAASAGRSTTPNTDSAMMASRLVRARATTRLSAAAAARRARPRRLRIAHDRNHLALNVDDAFNDFRGPRQRRDFDHAQDAIHYGKRQCVGLPVNLQQEPSKQGNRLFHQKAPVSTAGATPMTVSLKLQFRKAPCGKPRKVWRISA